MAAKFVAPMLLIFFLALFGTPKQNFKSYDVLSTTSDIDEDRDKILEETFIYSSVWNYSKHERMVVRPTGRCLRVLLLLICGDVEICPGPRTSTKCRLCSKTVRRNQANVFCVNCKESFHLKCVGSVFDDSEFCMVCTSQQNGEEVQNTESEDSDVRRQIPEMDELLNKRGLKIFHQNIRGLLLKKNGVEEFLSSCPKIDMLGLSETHLNGSVSEEELKINGFQYVRKDRALGPAGGVGVYIKQGLSWHGRYDPEVDGVECLWIEILSPKCKGFLVGNIYRPPDGSKYLDKDFDPKLDDMLDSAMAEEKEVLLLGDLNCNYPVQNDHKDLKQIMRYNGLKQMVKNPTRITKSTEMSIDLIFCSHPDRIIKTNTIPSSLSDHEMAGLIRKINCLKYRQTTIITRNFANYSQDDYCADMNSAPWMQVFSQNNVNDGW